MSRIGDSWKSALLYLGLGLLLMWRWGLGEVYLPADCLDNYYPFRAQLEPHSNPGGSHLIDVVTIYQPQDIYYGKWLKQGVLPLWDDLAFCGHPLQAGNQQALLYPPKVLFYFLFNPEVAHNVFLLFHVVLAGIGMDRFLRSRGLSHLSASLGGICWMLNGATMVRLECKPFLPFSAILPWGMLCIALHSQSPSYRSAARVGLIFGLAMLAGNAQFAVYVGLMGAAYYLFQTIVSQRRLELVKLGVGAFVLALLVGAVAALPTLELTKFSNRPVLSLQTQLAQNQFRVENLLALCIPEVLGTPRERFFLASRSGPIQNPLELTAHVGLGALLLALFSLPAFRRKPEVGFFWTVSLGALLIAGGSPLYHLFYYLVPGAKFFTNTRIILLFAFAASCLAAYGLEEGRKTVPRPVLILASALWIGLMTTMAYAIRLFDAQSETAVRFLEKFYQQGGFSIYRPGYVSEAVHLQEVTASIFAHYSGTNFTLLIPLLSGLFCLVFLAVGNRARYLIPALVACELLVFAWYWNPSVPFGETYSEQPAIRQLQDSQRTVGLISAPQPNIITAYGVHIAGGYDSILLGSYSQLFQFWNGAQTPFQIMCVLTQKSEHFERMARICAVDRYITDPFTQLEGDNKLIYDGDLKVYEVENALSRARVCYAWTGAVRSADAITAMIDPAFEPRDRVVVASPDSGGTPGIPGRPAEIVDDTPNRKVVEADLQAEGYLVLSDNYYPGWSVLVNGERGELEIANTTFMGVRLPAGQHRVEFRFRPFSFWLGLTLTIFGTLLGVMVIKFSPSE